MRTTALYSLYFLLLIALFFTAASFVEAFTMSNSNWIVEMGNLNSFAGKKSNGNYTLTDTGGQLGPGLYSGTNYQVRSGFQYIYSISQFKFSLTSLFIDFGTISNSFVKRAQTATITNGSAHGYAITIAQNHQMLVPATGAMIPNTSCNSGTCTTAAAGQWDNILTYGLGIRCEYTAGSTCASDFNGGSEYYRPIADLSANQTPQAIMSSSVPQTNKSENLTYKINVSTSQAAGDYSNQIIFVATPTF